MSSPAAIAPEPSLASRTSIKYRPDVDGLRAIAVLSVVAFHLQFKFVPGGFVGVDIFFVISGYLISAIIMRDIAHDRFSILGFYERRIRRIFPAMLAMFAIVTALATWLLLPREVVTYAWSLLAALFSGSNFFFWHQVGYFDVANAYKPLLHTWSLAVEEQFYVLFPPFLLVLRKFAPRHTRLALFTLTAASLIASIFVVRQDATPAFYFAPLRAWELMFGTILSQHYLPQLRRPLTRHVASLAGLILILGPCFLYTKRTPFPGLNALPPCLGAALLIAAGETGPSIGGRFLAWRPVVFVGLISYSFYLWHWPVMAFQSSSYLFVPQRFVGHHVVRPVLLLIIFILAVLSWAFVERPFRSGLLRTRRSLFLSAAAATGLLSLAAIALIASDGLPNRFPPDALAVAGYANEDIDGPWRHGSCFLTPNIPSAKFQKDVCLAQHPRRLSVLLLGDSHAASLYPGLVAALPDHDILQANASACLGLIVQPPSHSNNCQQLMAFAFDDFLVNHHVDTLLLAGRWEPASYRALGTTIGWAHEHNIPILLVGPNLEFNSPLPRTLATAIRSGHPENLKDAVNDAPRDVDRDLTRLAQRWHVPYVSFFANFCHTDCPVYAAPLVPFTSDLAHLTLRGGALYSSVIANQVRSIEAASAGPVHSADNPQAALPTAHSAQ